MPLSAAPPLVDVCVCTFRRESLTATLTSLDAQTGVSGRIRVLVADNDDQPSARGRVEDGSARWPRVYLHAPARNISVARNALLEASTATFVAWIDDDEIADPRWLAGLLNAIGDSDAVFGPVLALYPPETPAWIRQADLHSTQAVVTAAGVVTGYTSNARVRRSAVGLERFSEALGVSGGEDTEFFSRLHRLGRRFSTAPAAIVQEPTAPDRLSLKWLARRAYRAGQTHARAYLMSKRRLAGLVAASAKAAFCMAMCAVFVWNGVRWRKFWVRGALHRGVIASLIGARDLQLYATGR